MARRNGTADTEEQYQTDDTAEYQIDESALPGGSWETVIEESPTVVVFDTIGDQWVGQYLGEQHIVPENGDEPFDRFLFRGQDGDLYAVNKSYKLNFENIPVNSWCRLTYMKNIPTGRKLNPMKDIKVEVRR